MKAPSPRFLERYKKELRPSLMSHFSYRNVYQVPQLVKIVLNMGVGKGSRDSKQITMAVDDLTCISGQRAVICYAKRSEASFKLRAGMAIGCKVTLRRWRMYEFLDRLVTIALPRVRDFRGFSARSFDGRGNYALGVREIVVFPEIDYDKVEGIRGLDVCIHTNASSDKEAQALLAGFDVPFTG